MKKGKGSNTRNGRYWQNKILRERQNPNARFKARFRAKERQRNRLRPIPRKKGEKWMDRIKRGQGQLSKYTKKKTPPVKTPRKVSKLQFKSNFKGFQKPLVKPMKKSLVRGGNRRIGNYITPKRIYGPVTSRKASGSLKKSQTAVKNPRPITQKSPTKASQDSEIRL